MARPKKVGTNATYRVDSVITDIHAPSHPVNEAHTPTSAELLAGIARSDMPALLAKAKAEGDKPLIAAILEACRK